MTLTDRLQTDMTNAMRQRDEVRLEALRMAIAAAYNAEKAAGRSLTDQEVLAVLSRELKARRESLEAFTAADRTDAAARERAKIDILTGYMPQQLTESELEALAADAIQAADATSPRDMGKVMATLGPRIQGRADGKLVSATVARLLAQRDLAGHGH